MANSSISFLHHANARRSPAIIKLRMKFGDEGYARYFMLMEILREMPGYHIKHSEIDAAAFDMQAPVESLEALISFCIEFGLFVSDGERFSSPSLLKNMAVFEERQETYRNNALKRWHKEKDANAMQLHSNGNTMAMQHIYIKEKENQNEIKGKESARGNHLPPDQPFPGKTRYGDHVELSEIELDHAKLEFLRRGLAPEDVPTAIQFVDKDLENHPEKRGSNHYKALVTWALKAVLEEKTHAQRLKNAQKNGKDPPQETREERMARIKAELEKEHVT